MNLKQYIALFITVTCLITNLNAQTTKGSIKGKVTTSDGKPAEFVNIGIKGTSKGTTANSQGEFEIKNIEAGNYTLITSFIGLEDKEQPVEVKAGEVTALPAITLQESSKQLQELVITSVKSANEKTTNIGKIAIKPMDLPQSVSVIDRAVLEQQQSLRMSDALKNMNGIYIMGNTGGTQEEIAGRGFAFSSSNTFKNGVRFNNSAMPEMSSLETIEAMKGSSAILFGNVAPGGVLNLITKKPQFQSGGEVSMRVGSFDFYKPSVDIYGAVNNSEKVAYRVNTTYEKSRSFRDEVKAERFYINPSVLVKATDKLTFLFEADYLADDRTLDYGVGAIDYTLIDLPINTFLGAKWSYNKTEQQSATSTISYNLSNNWKITNITAYQNYNNDLFGTNRPNSSSQFVKADGTWKRGLQRTRINEDYYISQIDLTGKFETGFLKHNLLVGIDGDKYLNRNTAHRALAVYDSINVFDLNKYTQRYDIPNLIQNTTTTSPISRAGAYIQDLISITEKIKVLAGVRISYLETFSEVYTHATDATVKTQLFDHAVTPRFGLVYQPIKSMSIFGSYANSFSINTGVDINGKPLEASMIDQYEAGIKNDLFNGLISANATVYQIKNSNLAQTSLENGNTNSNIKELAGEVTSQGLELDIMSKSWNGLSFIAGYSYNQTKYTKSNIYIVGSLLRYNPNHTANGTLYYAFNQNSALKNFNAGLGIFYVGERMAGRSTRLTIENDTYKLIPLPEYALLDASLGYSKDKISVRVKVSNIMSQKSYNVHDDNSVNPIAPRQIAATVSFKL